MEYDTWTRQWQSKQTIVFRHGFLIYSTEEHPITWDNGAELSKHRIFALSSIEANNSAFCRTSTLFYWSISFTFPCVSKPMPWRPNRLWLAFWACVFKPWTLSLSNWQRPGHVHISYVKKCSPNKPRAKITWSPFHSGWVLRTRVYWPSKIS